MLRLFISVLIICLFTGFGNARTQREKDIARLQSSPFYDAEWQGKDILKLTDRLTGATRYFDVSDHPMDIRALGGEMQVIDLINADTTLYNRKYIKKAVLPVGSYVGYPLVIGDFNHNGKTDIAGTYYPEYTPKLADCAVLEAESDTTFSVRKVYTDSTTVALAATDVDHDGLSELNLRSKQYLNSYESRRPDGFPDTLNLTYRMWQEGGSVAYEEFSDFDRDGWTDVLYLGNDTLSPFGYKIYIAEYDPILNRFEQKFRYALPEWCDWGFSYSDLDGDGYTEFSTASMYGDVYIFENSGNDDYDLVYSDTIYASNAYLNTATNDIDGNGKPEFFIGGSSYYNGISGSRVYWFEADGDNSYKKVRSFFLLGTGFLGTLALYHYDVNNDGVDDLVFCYSWTVVILIWNREGHFDLFYLDKWEDQQELHAANVYDIWGTGISDLLLCARDSHNPPLQRTYLYRNNFATGIAAPFATPARDYLLYPNYPNPFNSQTTVTFYLPVMANIELTIYDTAGRAVVHLIENRQMLPGEHRVNWNGKDQFGKGVSSGIYLYELSTGSYREVKKMILLR